MSAISAELPPRMWRGWWFWRVTVLGRCDPVAVATGWSLADVIEHAIGLAIRGILEDC